MNTSKKKKISKHLLKERISKLRGYSEFTNKVYKQSNLTLGYRTGYAFLRDPKYFAITSSRYKFVGKMFENYNKVLEIGAGDGFKSLIVKSFCKELTLTDRFLEDKKAFEENYSFADVKYKQHNFIEKHLNTKYDGIYGLDILEHISKKQEAIFLKNITKSLNKHGTLIMGMPSIESQKYGSKFSKKFHINCKSKNELRISLKRFFYSVYMFSMNDEVLHTGFDQMSHYIIGLATSKKN